jgi:hypothetical protein
MAPVESNFLEGDYVSEGGDKWRYVTIIITF